MGAANFVLGAALRDLRRAGVGGGVALVLAALSVLILGATLAGLAALDRLVAGWRAELRIVAVLREETGRADAGQRVLTAARGLPGAGAVRYVSSADALGELRRYLGAAGDGLERLSVNPVPARLEVTPAPGLDGAALHRLVEALGQLPGVAEVQAAISWIDRVERLARGIRHGGLALGGGLGVLAIMAIAGGTARARQRRADETAVLRLAGAGEVAVWGPLLLQALAVGGAGAALGWGLLWLASDAGLLPVGAWLERVLGLRPLPFPGWGLGAMGVGAGAVAGLLGGLGAGRP